MNFASASLTIRWLIRDTFRQAVASRISWVMLLVSGVAIVFCLSVGISGESSAPPPLGGYQPEYIPEKEAKRLQKEGAGTEVRVISGDLTLLFGAIRIPLQRTRLEAIRLVQVILARDVADTAGLLLALVWT